MNSSSGQDLDQDAEQEPLHQDEAQQSNPAPPNHGENAAPIVAKDGASHQFSNPLLLSGDEHLNDDDRNKWDWKSRWDNEATKNIQVDAMYVGSVFLLTLLAIILTWRGTTFAWVSIDCASCVRSRFDQFAYFFLGGMLGGTLFGIKYLYKVVARGRWNLDRRLWRVFSPFISGGLALAIGTLIDSGIFGLAVKSPTASSYLSLGFISGYFADNALAKMQEIAETIFGTPERHKPAQSKSQQQSTKN